MKKNSTHSKIIELFTNTPKEFISGQAISEKLSISRNAVWKHIKGLKDEGFQFTTVTGKGYKLISSPEPFNEEEILKEFKKHKVDCPLKFFKSVESTNITAYDLAKDGAPHGTVVVSDFQKNGKGRIGRQWSSPKGKNLYLSIIVRPNITPFKAQTITLATAVALADTIFKETNIKASVKWPNDILIEGKKAAGILTEMNSETDRVNFIIIGIGVNLNSDFKLDSPVVANIATSLKEKSQNNTTINRAKFCASLVNNFNELYKSFLDDDNTQPILKRWSHYFDLIGKTIEVKGPPHIKGLCMGIDEMGALLVKTDGNTIEKVTFGDILY